MKKTKISILFLLLAFNLLAQDPACPPCCCFDQTIVTLEADTIACGIEDITLMATSSDNNSDFFWSTGANDISVANSDITVTVNQTTTYTVTITNSIGCEFILDIEIEFIDMPPTVTIKTCTAPGQLPADWESNCTNDETIPCIIDLNNEFSVPGSGTWSGNSVPSSGLWNISSIVPGVYTFTYSIGLDCSEDYIIEIQESVPYQHISFCSNDTGGPYDLTSASYFNISGSYLIQFDSGCSSPGTSNIVLGSFDPSTAVPGNYVYSISNITGVLDLCSNCTSLVEVTVYEKPDVSISGVLEICESEQLQTITANITNGGTAPFQFNWSNGASSQSIVWNTTDTYTVTVTDANSCSSTASVNTIVNPDPIASITGVDDACGQGIGSATVSGSSGTPGYQYLWSDLQTTSTAVNLLAGTYTVTLTDSEGCTDIEQIIIDNIAGPTVSISGIIDICDGDPFEQITADVNGGTAPIQFNWSTGSSSNNITWNVADTYTVTVTDDLGCTATSSVTTTIDIAPTVNINPVIDLYCNPISNLNLNSFLLAGTTLGGNWYLGDISGQCPGPSGEIPGGIFNWAGANAGVNEFTYIVTGTGACSNDCADGIYTVIYSDCEPGTPNFYPITEDTNVDLCTDSEICFTVDLADQCYQDPPFLFDVNFTTDPVLPGTLSNNGSIYNWCISQADLTSNGILAGDFIDIFIDVEMSNPNATGADNCSANGTDGELIGYEIPSCCEDCTYTANREYLNICQIGSNSSPNADTYSDYSIEFELRNYTEKDCVDSGFSIVEDITTFDEFKSWASLQLNYNAAVAFGFDLQSGSYTSASWAGASPPVTDGCTLADWLNTQVSGVTFSCNSSGSILYQFVDPSNTDGFDVNSANGQIGVKVQSNFTQGYNFNASCGITNVSNSIVGNINTHFDLAGTGADIEVDYNIYILNNCAGLSINTDSQNSITCTECP